jgi:hypothetical protein
MAKTHKYRIKELDTLPPILLSCLAFLIGRLGVELGTDLLVHGHQVLFGPHHSLVGYLGGGHGVNLALYDIYPVSGKSRRREERRRAHYRVVCGRPCPPQRGEVDQPSGGPSGDLPSLTRRIPQSQRVLPFRGAATPSTPRSCWVRHPAVAIE